jgi:hypothetical protein
LIEYCAGLGLKPVNLFLSSQAAIIRFARRFQVWSIAALNLAASSLIISKLIAPSLIH